MYSALTCSTWMHCKPEAALLGCLALFMHVLVPYACAHKARAAGALGALQTSTCSHHDPTSTGSGWEVLW